MSWGALVLASSNVTLAVIVAVASGSERAMASTPFTASSDFLTIGPHSVQLAWWTASVTVRCAACAGRADNSKAAAVATTR